jgi:hypothetical protein
MRAHARNPPRGFHLAAEQKNRTAHARVGTNDTTTDTATTRLACAYRRSLAVGIQRQLPQRRIPGGRTDFTPPVIRVSASERSEKKRASLYLAQQVKDSGGSRKICLMMNKMGTTAAQRVEWRRGELNPRPEMTSMMASTCLAGVLISTARTNIRHSSSPPSRLYLASRSTTESGSQPANCSLPDAGVTQG